MRRAVAVILAIFFAIPVGVRAADFTPAAQLKPPPGKTLYGLPVDQKASKPIRIAEIMVQNNPFGRAVKEGADYATSIHRSSRRPCRT